MHEFAESRKAIEAMIRSGDLEGLLRQAEAIHGHLCPFVSLGVKAGQYAMKYLDTASTGMEEVVAIVECNNCFTDGIQVVTGCTFGNNALIFKDWGKTAVTVARRADGKAVRLAVKPDYRERLFEKYPAAGPLFERVVVKRQATHEDLHRFQHVWEGMAKRELAAPLEEQLSIKELTLTVPEYAPIFASVVCQCCGEAVMEPKARLKDGRPICLACAGVEYGYLTGQGLGWARNLTKAY
jgi:formylmethanofuran dehydrogenase subunit E|uniref:Formylmethanofuran dehydrogenase n=1 Tax=Desulfobacca acetoxidans TaxID=60893 RepID=A0A7C3SHT3_9BACT